MRRLALHSSDGQHHKYRNRTDERTDAEGPQNYEHRQQAKDDPYENSDTRFLQSLAARQRERNNHDPNEGNQRYGEHMDAVLLNERQSRTVRRGVTSDEETGGDETEAPQRR